MLIDLYITINFTNKYCCTPSTNCAAHEKKSAAEKEHISKVETYLKKSAHLSFIQKVEDGV